MTETHTPTLLPCPFCGGDDISIDKAGYGSHYFCQCNDCDVVQDYDHGYSKADAIAAWNRRAVNSHTALVTALTWVETWVSQPVGAYSVHALDGLFSMTRERIRAALSTEGEKDAPKDVAKP